MDSSYPRALYQIPSHGGLIRCVLCPHQCQIPEGRTGQCGVRRVLDGRLVTTVYGFPVGLAVDPIEKKPLFHFLPGARTLSYCTPGCNLRCSFCQNAHLSQNTSQAGSGRFVRPDELVAMAVNEGASVVAHTYTEPTVYFEYAVDVAREARCRGRKNVLVTNGYIELDPLNEWCQVVDAANVDLKSFSDRTYQTVCKGRLAPVLRTIETMVSNGIWLEVTTLLIPGVNDSDEELRKLTGFLVALDAGIPWHVSRFHPDYRMLDRPVTSPESLRKAMDIGRQAGLHFVYGGNMSPGPHEFTRCPSCGTVLVRRSGFQVIRCSVTEGCCPSCATPIPGRWLA